jgi:outer membrane protein assembly factor BamB
MAFTSPVAELEIPDIALPPKPRRRWPALLLVALGIVCYLLQFAWVAAPEVIPAMPVFMASMWGPMLCTLLLGLWWLVLGSPSWRTGFSSVAVALVLLTAVFLTVHPSARMFITMKAIPIAAALVTVFLCFAGSFPSGLRTVAAVGLASLAFLPWEFLQFNGVTGQFGMDPHWRWEPSAEDQAASFDQDHTTDTAPSDVPSIAGPTDWPAFRGPQQDGVVSGCKVGDWKTLPKEVWRRPVGPGWSSFSIVGDRLFTQEQRGPDELVVCYRASTGSQLWSTGDTVRYSDMPSGVGPRGTPTFHDGKVYTFGATGILNCLNAGTGQRLWQVDLQKTVGATLSPFGFASSPLVLGDQVIVLPGSKTGPRLIAYQAKTGQELWQVGSGAISYSTPHSATIAGVPLILAFNADGLFAHDPASGKQLWKFDCKAEETAPVCVQPMILPDERIVLGGGRPGVAAHCIKATRQGDAWTVEELWDAPFYPAFNDYVRIGDNLYSLEGGRLTCVDANTGKRRWKDGHYGAGQVLLAGDRLLVLAESGRLALVNPTPERWQELASIPALSDKTWNHMAIANGRLFVRNGREMVCFELEK